VIAPLTNSRKKHLRGLGHTLSPLVLIGKEGVSTTVIGSIEDALQAHELIKVKMGKGCLLDKKETAQSIAAQTGSSLVQLVGKTMLFYRPNPDKPNSISLGLP
jgi:RNA-binding protein